METKTNEMNSLVKEFMDELDQRGYSQGAKWCYGKVCREIINWCSLNKITHFDESVGLRFCDETIGGHLSKTGSSLRYRKTLRVTRMLISFQRDGDFEFRAPKIEYVFSNSMKTLVNQYLDYCIREKKLAPPSVADRRLTLLRLDVFFAGREVFIEGMNADLFEEFLQKYCARPTRRKSYKSMLREFYRYLYDSGKCSKDLSTLILKEPKAHYGSSLPTTYTEGEIKKIIQSVDRSSAKGKRDYLVLLLAAEYGWRASDIITFRMVEIDWDNNRITKVQYKTGVPVRFSLLASVGNAIIDYIRFGRPEGGDDVIIANHENKHKGKKLSSPTIHSIVSAAIKKANVKNWQQKKHGPHSLRHSLATNMLKKNVSLPIISTILGHQSTETTKIYLEVDIEKLRLCSLPIPPLCSEYFNIANE